VVGKISGVYKKTTANAAEIPNFPIMLNVTLKGINDVSPANSTAKHTLRAKKCTAAAVCMHAILHRRDLTVFPPDNHHCSDDVYLKEGGYYGEFFL